MEAEVIAQLVKKFPAFYATWRFIIITMFTRACNCTLFEPGDSSSQSYILFLQIHVVIILTSVSASPK
jgi:hypothetical protein